VSPHQPRVVAELGRPETPQETADRKAAASATRRANQTWFNLVLALLASLAIVAFLVIVVVRPDQSAPKADIDWAKTAAEAQGAVSQHLVVPVLPTGWGANRAEYNADTSDGVPTWGIGFLTPKNQYIGLTQGLKANDSWVADQLAKHRATGATTIDGVSWVVYDRRDADDPGNLAYALVAEFDGSDVVLAGTASDAEFRTLATAVADDQKTAAGKG
jgi:hypothetical protein